MSVKPLDDPPPTAQCFRIWPHRSLSPRAAKILMAAFCAYSLGLGGFFWAQGAWPIFAFLGLDILLLALLWRAHQRAGNRCDEIELDHRAVRARRRVMNRVVAQAEFPSPFTRVTLEGAEDRANNNAGRLALAYGRERFAVGQFLTREEKIELHAALDAALTRARAL